MQLTDRERRAFSLAKCFQAMSSDGLSQSSIEGEMLASAAAEAGRHFDKNRIYLPLSLMAGLKRDMTSAGASGSQYLVSSNELSAAVDVLRPWSVAIGAGVTVLPGLTGNTSVPTTTTPTTAYWLTNEATAITESQPTVTAVTLTPKMVGAYVEYSRLMRLQSDVENVIRRDLLRTVGALVDRAILAGTAANGQPQGIIGAAGVGTQSGTSLAWAGLLAMEQAISEANAEPSAYVTTAAVRKLLKSRERASGSGLIWNDYGLNGKPGFATVAMPSATLIAGDFASCVLGIFGNGIQIEIDPSTGFQSGKYGMRCTMSIDVALTHPGALSVCSSIT